MPHLTLVGGPYAKARTANAPLFTAPQLILAGERYLRSPASTRDDIIYTHERFCEHEWSDWYLAACALGPDLRGMVFDRYCRVCLTHETISS